MKTRIVCVCVSVCVCVHVYLHMSCVCILLFVCVVRLGTAPCWHTGIVCFDLSLSLYCAILDARVADGIGWTHDRPIPHSGEREGTLCCMLYPGSCSSQIIQMLIFIFQPTLQSALANPQLCTVEVTFGR